MAKGDHITVQRYLPTPYTHHGIDCGDGTVVHYTGEVLQKKDARIKRTTLKQFLNGTNRWQVVEYGKHHDPNEVVRRALSRVGEDGYDLLFNNCEHFARWCKTGHEISQQVRARAHAGVAGVSISTGATASMGAISTAGAVAGMSGSGVMSGLAAAGSVVGGGAIAGVATLSVAPAVATIALVNNALNDDEHLGHRERRARAIGRKASVVGAAGGVAGSVAAISASGAVAGTSAAGITSGLAAIGGFTGGGMAAGAAISIAAPAIIAAGVGVGAYKLVQWLSE